MTMIPMRALVPFTHEGVCVRQGDHLEVGPIVAATLHHQHKADFVTAGERPDPIRKRRTYRRRDLQAES